MAVPLVVLAHCVMSAGHPCPRVFPSGTSLPIATFVGALAAAATFLTFLGGIVIGWRYRKKATLDITAEAHVTDQGIVLATRPSLSSVGPFRLTFASDGGDVVSVTPLTATGDGGYSVDETDIITLEAFPDHEFVGQGETVTSTQVVRLPRDAAVGLIGWNVAVNVTSRGWIRNGISWMARAFVPAPDYRDGHDG